MQKITPFLWFMPNLYPQLPEAGCYKYYKERYDNYGYYYPNDEVHLARWNQCTFPAFCVPALALQEPVYPWLRSRLSLFVCFFAYLLSYFPFGIFFDCFDNLIVQGINFFAGKRSFRRFIYDVEGEIFLSLREMFAFVHIK